MRLLYIVLLFPMRVFGDITCSECVDLQWTWCVLNNNGFCIKFIEGVQCPKQITDKLDCLVTRDEDGTNSTATIMDTDDVKHSWGWTAGRNFPNWLVLILTCLPLLAIILISLYFFSKKKNHSRQFAVLSIHPKQNPASKQQNPASPVACDDTAIQLDIPLDGTLTERSKMSAVYNELDMTETPSTDFGHSIQNRILPSPPLDNGDSISVAYEDEVAMYSVINKHETTV